jgi:hypothetical protein
VAGPCSRATPLPVVAKLCARGVETDRKSARKTKGIRDKRNIKGGKWEASERNAAGDPAAGGGEALRARRSTGDVTRGI